MDTVQRLNGHYAFVALFNSGELVGVRNHEPLILGIGGDDLLLTSDVIGLPENFNSVVYIDNNQFVIIDKNKYRIFDYQGHAAQFAIKKIPKNYQNVTKGTYEYFTAKEIFEQPDTVLVAGEEDNKTISKKLLISLEILIMFMLQVVEQVIISQLLQNIFSQDLQEKK